VLQHNSTQHTGDPLQRTGSGVTIDVRRQIAREATETLLFIEALFTCPPNKLPDIDLATVFPSLVNYAARSTNSECDVHSNSRLNTIRSHGHHQQQNQQQQQLDRHESARTEAEGIPAVTISGPAQIHQETGVQSSLLCTDQHETHVAQLQGSAHASALASKSSAGPPAPPRKEARAVGDDCVRGSMPPSEQAGAHKTPRDVLTSPSPTKSPENGCTMGLRQGRKRKVLSLLNEDPEWAAEVLKKEKARSHDARTKDQAQAQAPVKQPVEKLRPDLSNASEFIDQRRGVYFKCDFDSLCLTSGRNVLPLLALLLFQCD
jgi:hypothetical protein